MQKHIYSFLGGIFICRDDEENSFDDEVMKVCYSEVQEGKGVPIKETVHLTHSKQIL